VLEDHLSDMENITTTGVDRTRVGLFVCSGERDGGKEKELPEGGEEGRSRRREILGAFENFVNHTILDGFFR